MELGESPVQTEGRSLLTMAVLVGLAVVVLRMVVAELPSIRRYLRMERM